MSSTLFQPARFAVQQEQPPVYLSGACDSRKDAAELECLLRYGHANVLLLKAHESAEMHFYADIEEAIMSLDSDDIVPLPEAKCLCCTHHVTPEEN